MIAVDTNVLIYAISAEDDVGRTALALNLLDRIAKARPILPLQVVGEYLNVSRRSKDIDLADALMRIELVMDVYRCVSTLAEDFVAAVAISARFNLQYFDAVIIAVARRAGATMLLSEDMHDGLEVEGLRIVNPFMAENAKVIVAALN